MSSSVPVEDLKQETKKKDMKLILKMNQNIMLKLDCQNLKS